MFTWRCGTAIPQVFTGKRDLAPPPPTSLSPSKCAPILIHLASGIVASGNGDSSDTSNLDNTFLRGIQETDEDGVAQFETIFPGHYTSRATHIHIIIHTNATVYENGTLGQEVSASHVGQAFFDQGKSLPCLNPATLSHILNRPP